MSKSKLVSARRSTVLSLPLQLKFLNPLLPYQYNKILLGWGGSKLAFYFNIDVYGCNFTQPVFLEI